MTSEHRFNHKWSMAKDYPATNGMTAFGTFVCGGGSSMGYKLAGYNHLGGVEFTEHYAKLYKANHNPKYLFVEDVRDFNNREDLPKELYNLDFLDGSPPCAAFSTSGAREKNWRKKSSYEGKSIIKDDLVFVYIDTVFKLMPKVFLMENVTGLMKGNAKTYLKNIVKKASEKYAVQVFKLNAASMGVPQMRERVFIIGLRKDIKKPKLALAFNETPISFEEATKEHWHKGGPCMKKYAIYQKWKEIKYPTEITHPKWFNLTRPSLNRPSPTIVEKCHDPSAASVCHPLEPRKLNKYEASALQSFPTDYNFLDQNPLSAIGRSVPPVMTAQIAHQIYLQWLKPTQP